jgi:drug/metabolite transporter (DMT)-like permease
MIMLLGAAAIGAFDIVLRNYSRHIGDRMAMITTEAAGLIVIIILMVLFDWESLTKIPPLETLAWGVAISVCNYAGTRWLFRALNKGPISLVSPITSGFAVIVAVITLAVAYSTKQEFNWVVIGATLIMSAAIMHIVSKSAEAITPASGGGLFDAIRSVFALGIFYYGVAILSEQVGIFMPILIMRITTLGLAVPFYKESKDIFKADHKSPRFVLLLVLLLLTGLDTGQFLAYDYASQVIPPSLASALLSTYPIFSVVFAQTLGGERGIISRSQLRDTMVIIGSVFVAVLFS